MLASFRPRIFTRPRTYPGRGPLALFVTFPVPHTPKLDPLRIRSGATTSSRKANSLSVSCKLPGPLNLNDLSPRDTQRPSLPCTSSPRDYFDLVSRPSCKLSATSNHASEPCHNCSSAIGLSSAPFLFGFIRYHTSPSAQQAPFTLSAGKERSPHDLL